jgi:FMN phosphatase YigB (HAD superfamily)
MSPFTTLIFDLDDTILNTHELITHRALKDVCQAMIEAGLSADMESCLTYRSQYIIDRPNSDFFTALAGKFGQHNEASLRKTGHDKYAEILSKLDYHVPQSTHKLLSDLKIDHDLFLVTAGNRMRQMLKVNKIKIAHYFQDMMFVDTTMGMTKRECFATILKATKALPTQCLAIGNRVDMEIAEAKSLDLQTCLVLTGEYRFIKPKGALEIPDYTIESLEELKHIC